MKVFFKKSAAMCLVAALLLTQETLVNGNTVQISAQTEQPAQTAQPVQAADVEEQCESAEVFFTGTVPTSTGFALVEAGNDKTPNVAVYGGETCWLLDRSQSNNKAYINFTLSDSFKPSSFDGTEYDIEIDYFDTGTGYLRLYYLGPDGEDRYDHTIYTQNEQKWKTARFTLVDADFGGREKNPFAVGGCDFYLSIRARSDRTVISGESMAVKRVKVTKKPMRHGVYAQAKIDQPGNTFKWFDESKIINTTLTNYFNRSVSTDVTYRVISESGYLGYEKTERVDFAPNEVKNIDLDIGALDRCDVYWFKVTIKRDDGIQSELTPTKLAIIKTDPDGILNHNVSFSTHFERVPQETMEMGMELIKMSNAGGIREAFKWSEVLINGQLDYENSTVKPIVEAVKKHGLDYLCLLSGTPTSIGEASNDIPTTPEQLAAWREYARFAAITLQDVTDCFEVWNEPCIASFNLHVDTVRGKEYTELIKAAYEEIKAVNPNAKIGGPSITGISITTIGSGLPYFTECMDAGMWRYTDAVVLHPYTSLQPDISGMIENISYYKNEYKKVGIEDIDVWNSEVGYSVTRVGSEQRKGAYNCQTALVYKQLDLGEKINLYNFEKKGTIETDREDQFGHVMPGLSDAWDTKLYGTYYLPTESFLMVAGMNYVMAESTAAGILNDDDDVRKVYQYKSDKFGCDIISLYTTNGSDQSIALNLGTDSVELYDSMGNQREIYSTDGIFTFDMGENPVYIVGDFTNPKIVEDGINITFGEKKLSVAYGDVVAIPITAEREGHYTIKVEESIQAEVMEIKPFSGKNANVYIKNNAQIGNNYILNIDVYEDGKLIRFAEFSITPSASVISSMQIDISPGNDVNNWYSTVSIQNVSMLSALKGYIEFKAPSFMNQLGRIDIGVIPSGRTGEITFHLPKIYEKGSYTFEYDLVRDTGETISFTEKHDFTVAPYAVTKPKIDGILEKDEWVFDAAMYTNKLDQIKQISGWGGADDLSARCIMMWDEENLYMCYDVTDNVFCQPEPIDSMWSGDSIQFGMTYGAEGFVAIGQENATFHELSVGLCDGVPAAYRYLSQDDYYPVGVFEDGEFAIVTDGNKTYYEFRIPWNSLLLPGQQPVEGAELGFSFLVNDNDGDGRRGWIEYTSGIGETKNSTMFTTIKLIK